MEDSIEGGGGGGQQEGETDKMTSEDQSGLVMLSLHTPYCIVACGMMSQRIRAVHNTHTHPPKPSMQNYTVGGGGGGGGGLLESYPRSIVYMQVASYPGPTARKRKGLVSTVCACA